MTDQMENGYPEGEEMTPTDYNLDDEYKPEPLAPTGVYTGLVKKVAYESANNAIRWEVTAAGNFGILMVDGQTPLDGNTFFYRNWLPRPGDENVRTKSGRSTKRQAKINMLKDFQDKMQVDMNTPQAVQEAIMNGEWMGIPVIMNLDIDEYEGVTRNVIKKMVRSADDIPAPEDYSGDDIPF
jgi:hypothetical protein